MRANTNAPAADTARGADHDRLAVRIPRGVSEDFRAATAFLATLENPRLPWAERFTAWAAQHGLSEAEARAVKITILRLRLFSSVGPRGRRGRR